VSDTGLGPGAGPLASRPGCENKNGLHSTAFFVLSIIGLVFLGASLLMALVEPSLRYKIRITPGARLDSPRFWRVFESLLDSRIHADTRIEVLTDGDVFYEAELQAIRQARRNINLEAYIFQRGEVAARFVEALTERARAGVAVKLVLDALGCLTTRQSYFRELLAAGGRIERYHWLGWYDWTRINNRTHRELLLIDGEVGFIGGAGIADQWLHGRAGKPRWRDTVFRVEGRIVAALQATFAENWLETSGEILAGEQYFPDHEGGGQCAAMIVNSAPSAGGSSRARILFQTLLASAAKSISITTPYFLPDRSAREEMVRAIRERGVQVRVLTPGKHSDHLLTRGSSRQRYGPLLKAGAQIYEYQPGMMHAKVLIVDEQWSVGGSTNFDHRSFGLNDEVNLAVFHPPLAARLLEDFERDIARSRLVTVQDWKRRPLWERLSEWAGALIARQE
jgi:cardiolipin synthase A/B